MKTKCSTKILELLNEKYIFSEEKLPETKPNRSEDYSDKEKLYKWTGACETCCERGPKGIKSTENIPMFKHKGEVSRTVTLTIFLKK